MCGGRTLKKAIFHGQPNIFLKMNTEKITHPMKHKVRTIHFVGIGGAGMSGIAEVLFNLGYAVSGSDLAENQNTRRLRNLGVEIFINHAAENIQHADVLVTSTAVPQDNPEILAACEKNIPIVPRAMMLSELMRLRRGIAIAGTHGKTTTTSLVTSILAQAGLDPTFVIGGCLNAAGVNARLGKGEFIVAEADESDASFLLLSPIMAVVTNIDADHMATYAHDFSKLKNAFVDFLNRLPFYGVAILCGDDENVRAILPEVKRKIVCYGTNMDCTIRAENIQAQGTQMHFDCVTPAGKFPIVLNAPGRHNVLNALAAIAVADELNVGVQALQKALSQFHGVGRRFNLTQCKGGLTIIDDYGHHPSELRATIAAARAAFPQKRLVLAFQPHRYSRTRDCFEDFVEVLGSADALFLTEVYAAGEQPIVAADSRSLAHALRVRAQIEPIFVEDCQKLPELLKPFLQENDLLLMMGAGSIGSVAQKMMTENAL